jgi:hypothetical protein
MIPTSEGVSQFFFGYICCAGLENKCWDERVWDEVWCPIITLRLPVVRYFCFAGERRVLDRSLC